MISRLTSVDTYLLQKPHLISLLGIIVQQIRRHQPGQARADHSDCLLFLFRHDFLIISQTCTYFVERRLEEVVDNALEKRVLKLRSHRETKARFGIMKAAKQRD